MFGKAGFLVLAVVAGAAGLFVGLSGSANPPGPLAGNSGYMKGQEILSWKPVAGAPSYDLWLDGKKVSTAGKSAVQAVYNVKAGSHNIAVYVTPVTPTTSTTAATTTTGTTGSTGTTTTTQTTTSTPTTTANPPPAGQVSLSVSGTDTGCARNGAACATFNRALAVASAGDKVLVHGGSYPADAPPTNRNQLEGDKGSAVTFVCAGDGNVSFKAPTFIFWAGNGNVTFQGDCFHFHTVMVGLGGYPQLTHDIRLDGVHMEAPEIIGARNVQLVNSEIGPFEACGAADAPGYAACTPGSFYAQFPNGTDVVQQEPFIHNGSAGKATNILLDHDLVHGITSKWSGTHTGGLLIWNTDNLRITNTVFQGNAIYDIEQNAGSSDNGLVFQNDTFGFPVFTPDSGDPNANNGHREFECCGSGDSAVNWLIDRNKFVNGIRMDASGSKSGVVISNNDLGSNPDCGPFPGVTFVGNTRCG